MTRMLIVATVISAAFTLSTTAIAAKTETLHDDKTTSSCRCSPDQSCWPDTKSWQGLQQKLTGRLIKPVRALDVCVKDASSKACAKVLKTSHNPFLLQNNAGDSQSQGWLNAWENQASPYAIEATSTEDVRAGVNFAREHHLRIVVKGAGHDYLGRSNAADSLLIWTHKMRAMNYEEAFVPDGCESKGVPALTVGAGTIWLEAYDVATNQHHRYVQGGGCTTVGVAGGFTQGGGFGSFSKRFGTGAASVLQVEIVTADGKALIANQCQNQDLFWAIRGGGGSTFGIVTKMTLKTHALPSNFGLLRGTIKAANDAAFKPLIAELVKFYRDDLNNDHWGEQIRFSPDNTVTLGLTFLNLSEVQAKYTLSPLKAWLEKHKDSYSFDYTLSIIPADKLWNYDFMSKNHPDLVTRNKAGDAGYTQFWWTPNSAEVSRYWFSYQSWWLPVGLFDAANTGKLTNAIYQASRLTPTTLHINKGLAGAPKDVQEAVSKTATHPAVLDAAALVIINAATNQAYPGVKGKEPDLQKGKAEADKISRAIAYFKALAPTAGTYANEADYHMPDWQQTFWGENYARLLTIKKQVDPDGLFYCHHCVGSEMWTKNGMCPAS